MMISKDKVVWSVLFFWIFYGSTLLAQGTFEITRVGLDKKSFTPSDGETISISFEITKPADIEVLLYDSLGQHMKTLSIKKCDAGRQEIKWDGKTESGALACGNVVLYVIKAKSHDNEEFIFNPVKETGGVELKTLEYKLDTQIGEIEYVLPQTAMVRLRAGLNDGMFIKTILDWQPSVAGRHSLIWDGKDVSGMMNLLRHPGLEVRLSCYALPINTILIEGKTTDFPSQEKLATRSVVKQREDIWATKGKYLHYTHDPRFCHQPQFKISFPESQDSSEGRPVVQGEQIPIRITLDPKDAFYLANRRFEMMFFVDGIFVYEMEEGTSPFTLYLTSQGFSAGTHLLTVNIIGYDDHIGILSQPFILGEKP